MQLSIREATPEDRQKLANLSTLRFMSTGTWTGEQPWSGWVTNPTWCAEHEQEIIGALACPPDMPEIAWVRLFAAKSSPPLKDVCFITVAAEERAGEGTTAPWFASLLLGVALIGRVSRMRR